MDDRIIQQCIKQVLEPICEAKFHNHSYGFRPNRATEHAIARTEFLMWKSGLHYIVDIDIKGFFDNVNHGKLLKQLWTIGIQDKKLLCIISKILKSEIKGIGVPEKGTPQGGIISPLLSNVVLNELDWWLSDQWETFVTKHRYLQNNNKYRALKKTKLKEFFFVRYADDFKILLILGVHNYYKRATLCSLDFGEIAFIVNKSLYNRLKGKTRNKEEPIKTKTFLKMYGNYNCKTPTIAGITVFPIASCRFKTSLCFTQEICNYTEKGRNLVHDKLRSVDYLIIYLLKQKEYDKSVEYNDNRISLMAGQNGKCGVTKAPLIIGNMECHHKKPKELGGTDEYKNLMWVSTDTHRLIHAVEQEVIDKYLNKLNLDTKALKKVNS